MKCNVLVKLGAAICGIGCLADLYFWAFKLGEGCAIGLFAKSGVDPARIMAGINDEVNHVDETIRMGANQSFNGDYPKKKD